MSLQYGELWPTCGWDRFVSLGHSSKFQRVSHLSFVVAATSLTGGQPNFARCLAVFWAATRAKFSLRPKSCVLLYWQRYCTGLQQRASAKLYGVVQVMELRNFRTGRHLYSAGRPSRWASAHISSLYNANISVWWLGPRRFVTLVRSAVYKLSYLLTYLLCHMLQRELLQMQLLWLTV